METQERYEVASPEPTHPGGLIGAMGAAEAIAWCEEHDAWLFHQRGRWMVQVCWGAVVVHETGPSLVDVIRRLKDSHYARFCHAGSDPARSPRAKPRRPRLQRCARPTGRVICRVIIDIKQKE